MVVSVIGAVPCIIPIGAANNAAVSTDSLG
jgi:hypothetical protein